MPEKNNGNIFFVLFGAIALVGILGAATITMMRGPVRGMSEVTRHTTVQNDMTAAVAILSEITLAQANADCDLDGMVEPYPFKFAAAGDAPEGGGHIPDLAGTRKQDAWGTSYGYCAWDHGTKTTTHAVPACGGATANRLAGGDTGSAAVIAIVSAGPDRIFQTQCVSWLDNDHPVAIKPADSDDILTIVPYGQFLLPRTAQPKISELPDEACIPEAIGIMRTSLGVVQICTDTGWAEVGTAASTDANFIAVTNAVPGNQYTSNEISFSGFLNKKTVMVNGGATLLIDGNVISPPAEIAAGQTIALRAHAGSVPENTKTFSISVSGVQKTWTITTRDAYPPDLKITPSTSNMTVQGPGSPAYGTPEGFLIVNQGERSTQPLLPAMLSNTDNFEFHTAGSHQGDDCQGKEIGSGDSCVIDIRPKAGGQGTFIGTLSVTDGVSSASANMAINASGWTCTLPWGGTINNGDSVTAYLSDNVACGSGCTSEVRTCNGSVLSGSYTKESCNATANCSYSWYTGSYGSCQASPYWGSYGSWSSCSKTCGGGTQSRHRSCLNTAGTQTRTVYCQRSDGQTVSNAYCSGAAPASSRSCTGSCAGSSSESRSCNTQSCITCSNYSGNFAGGTQASCTSSLQAKRSQCASAGCVPGGATSCTVGGSPSCTTCYGGVVTCY